MKKLNWSKRKILIAILLIFSAIVVGFGGYCIYGIYKINALPNMTYMEMLEYTTKDNKAAAITVGIIQNGKMEYKIYGENSTMLPAKEHIYEIGSITKTFTASLLFKAISEGRIDLEDSIAAYINLPEKNYYPTIRRLVTHTAGYKGYYFEMPMISNYLHRKNHYKGISDEMLIKRLGKINLDDKDYSFTYSNFGMATLGVVLEQLYSRDYKELINEYISKDLGLTNTKVSDLTGDLSNYWEWMDSDAYIPAGAILSNITDMMKYVQLQIRSDSDYISAAHEALAEVNATTASYEKMGIHVDAVGAGWMLDNVNHIIWHNGGTGNYNSYIGFNKEKQTGVVILSNLPPNYRIPATVIGVKILTSLKN